MFKSSTDIAVAFSKNTLKSKLAGITLLVIAPMKQQPCEPGDKSGPKAHSDYEVKYRKKNCKGKSQDNEGGIDLILMAAKQNRLTKNINAPFRRLCGRSAAKQERKWWG